MNGREMTYGEARRIVAWCEAHPQASQRERIAALGRSISTIRLVLDRGAEHYEPEAVAKRKEEIATRLAVYSRNQYEPWEPTEVEIAERAAAIRAARRGGQTVGQPPVGAIREYALTDLGAAVESEANR